jgi:hypothetical protein
MRAKQVSLVLSLQRSNYDLIDLQNDLGGQSYKSKLFLENLVEQIVTYIYLS